MVDMFGRDECETFNQPFNFDTSAVTTMEVRQPSHWVVFEMARTLAAERRRTLTWPGDSAFLPWFKG